MQTPPSVSEDNRKKFFEMSERLERIRRNLIIFDYIAIVCWYFNIKIKGAAYLGISFEGVNNSLMYKIVLCLIIYELLNYIVRILSEYKIFCSERESSLALQTGNRLKVDTSTNYHESDAGTFPKSTPRELLENAKKEHKEAKAWVIVRLYICDFGIPLLLSLAGVFACVVNLTKCV